MRQTALPKDRTALVVIDLQKGITSMPVYPLSAEEVVGNAVRIADTFRERGMPVLLVHVLPVPPLGLRPETDAPSMAPGQLPPDWGDIREELGPKEGDVVVTKRQWGAFYGTDLEMQLRRRGITDIVLCGISTNVGVESTARFAYEMGFNQIFVEDAIAARSEEEHSFTMRTTFPRIGRVRSTSEILQALGGDGRGKP